MKSTGARSSNELQQLDLKIGHQATNASYGLQGYIPCSPLAPISPGKCGMILSLSATVPASLGNSSSKVIWNHQAIILQLMSLATMGKSI